eukprot:4789474-Pyramimonas_sp.AAC.1
MFGPRGSDFSTGSEHTAIYLRREPIGGGTRGYTLWVELRVPRFGSHARGGRFTVLHPELATVPCPHVLSSCTERHMRVCDASDGCD